MTKSNIDDARHLNGARSIKERGSGVPDRSETITIHNTADVVFLNEGGVVFLDERGRPLLGAREGCFKKFLETIDE